MQYRKFGRSDFAASVLGFGCMRFPILKKEDPSAIDEKEAIRMLRHGIDNGINYVDTAYPYHGGNSELVVAKALKDGYREKVKLATKLPTWLMNSPEDFDKYLNEQLKKLETDFIDVYLVHALDKERWEKMQKLGVLDFLNRALADGRIKYAGFSFHDDISVFRGIVDAYDWHMCQVQFNYMEDEAWEKEITYASEKGIAVIVMEPLLGGKLANNLNDDAKTLLAKANDRMHPVEWALTWVLNHPAVTLLLSGMSTMEQVSEDLAIADKASAGSLSQKELDAIQAVKQLYAERMLVKCTGCDYCQPCPNNVAISSIFTEYNNAALYNTFPGAKFAYKQFISNANKDASRCTECGQCEAACPQKLSIISHLKEAHEALI